MEIKGKMMFFQGEKTKIMLQGYLHDANFGDILSAHLFYNRCQKLGFTEIDFFQYKNLGIGEFCRKEIGYTRKLNIFSCLKADFFVIIAGGSFWNTNYIASDAKIRFQRFILPALLYQFLKKPVYILGVGGGCVDTPWLRKKMILVLNRANTVLFRDDYTKQVFSEYGVKNKMEVSADTALVVQSNMLEPLHEKNELEKKANGRKKLLLHIPDGLPANTRLNEIILPALIRFLTEHSEYFLVISNDNVREIDTKEAEQIQNLRTALNDSNIEFYDYKYHDCWQMCSLINEMDCVVTLKLHVGVVACAFDKCVVSFPVHREKTDNFYQMIGESERCMNVRKLDEEKAYTQLEKFHNKPVHISEELRRKAEQNLSVLNDIANENGIG